MPLTTNGRMNVLQLTQNVDAIRALANMAKGKLELWWKALQLKPISPKDVPTLQIHGVLWDDLTNMPDDVTWATRWLKNARDQRHSCFLYYYAGNYYTTAFPYNSYNYFVAALTARECSDRPIQRSIAEVATIIYGSRLFHVHPYLRTGEDVVIAYMEQNGLYGGDSDE